MVTVLNQFVLGKHTYVAWEVLKARVSQHQVIADGGATPSLADAATLAFPDGVSLLATLDMARGAHARRWVLLDTLL